MLLIEFLAIGVLAGYLAGFLGIGGGFVVVPVRCSRVVPGKFEVFARRPVSRLNSVLLPQFGVPTTAIVASTLPATGM